MGIEFRPHGLVGGHQALGDDLPPEDALLRHEAIADESECIILARGNVLEHFGKVSTRNPY